MNIQEFKKIYCSKNVLRSEKGIIFNHQNSVYMVNETPVDILFIGDSITERWEVYPYFHKFGNVVNRGIGGEATSALRERIELDAINLKPKVCVFSEGVNNLAELWRIEHDGKPVTEQMKEEVLSKYKADIIAIVKKLKANDIIPIVGSVLPIGVRDCRNELIIRENKILEEICKQEKVAFVDYYSEFISDDGITMQDLTFGDDLHPHVIGYNKMVKILMPILEEIFRRKD